MVHIPKIVAMQAAIFDAITASGTFTDAEVSGLATSFCISVHATLARRDFEASRQALRDFAEQLRQLAACDTVEAFIAIARDRTQYEVLKDTPVAGAAN